MSDVIEIEIYSGTPEIPDPKSTRRSEPPVKWRKHRFHWLHSERASGPAMSEWIDGFWWSAGEAKSITPVEMYRRGWDYWMPVALPAGHEEQE